MAQRERLTLLKAPAVSPLRASLQAFLLDREAARCSPRTLEFYEYTVGSFVAFLEGRGIGAAGGISAGEIRHYLVELQRRGVKDTTQHGHARGVRAWLNWLVAEGWLTESPMRRVAMPRVGRRVPEPFSPDEIRRLLDACDRSAPLGLRDYALVLVLLDSGLRAAEAAALRVGDVDMRSGLITIVGKGGKQRVVRLGAKARGAIARYLAARPGIDQDAPLWATPGGGRLSLASLQNACKRLGKRAGVHPCGPHRFRRTFALWCLRDGMDVYSLQQLMGHSSLAVLQRYLALASEDAERAHQAHSPVDRMLGR